MGKRNIDPIINGLIKGKLTLQTGSETTGNMYGADVLVRNFFGLTKEVYGFLPIRGISRDKWLPNFLCNDFKVTEGRGTTSEVRVTYIGLTGRIPLPEITGGWSDQTASVSTTINAGPYFNGAVICSGVGSVSAGGYLVVDANTTIPFRSLGNIVLVPAGKYAPQLEDSGEASVSYNAPETTYTYIVDKEPTGPIFGTQLQSAGNYAFQINEVRPATILGRIVYSLVTRSVKFDVKRQGAYWGVTEITRGQITSAMVTAGGYGDTGYGGDSGSNVINQFNLKLQQFSRNNRDPKTYR